MTPRTTERAQPEERSTDPEPPPWTDVISLELALRGESDGLQEEVEELADDSADEATLLGQIAQRWVRRWEISDRRLSRATDHEAKMSAMKEGLVRALIEAEDRGITKILQEEGVDQTWWFADLRWSDLKETVVVLWRAARRNLPTGNGSDQNSPECNIRRVRKLATGAEPYSVDAAVSPARVRAFLFASWVWARAERHAENYLQPELTPFEKTFPRWMMRL